MTALQIDRNPTYAPLAYFAGRNKHWLAIILALTIASSLLESLSIVAFFPVFVSLLGDSENESGGVFAIVNDLTELIPISSPIVAASVLLLGIFALKTVLTLTREFVTAHVGAMVMYNTRQQVMERYSDAHYQFILDNPQGGLLYNIFDAPSSVSTMIVIGTQFGTALFKVLAIVGVLIWIFPLAALALVVFGILYYIGIHLLSRKVSFPIGVKKAESSGKQISIANEFLTGFRQIVALNATGWWTSQFDVQNRAYSFLQRKELIWNAIPKPVMEFFAVGLMLVFALIIWVSGPATVAERLPTLGVFAVALAQLFPPLTSIGASRMRIMANLPNLALAHQAITGPIPARRDGTHRLEKFERAIEFENVSFGYPGREPLFNNVSLSFKKGEVTAIVGTSGSGKTTIINLMLGLFQPTEGRITIDGIPLQDLKQETWLSKIGFVSQETFTYHSTISENILIGRTDRTDESIVKAAKIANAHGFISELDDGYQTVVGERGMKFSGGQQQRLAIARALLDTPEFMLLDEATSSLDTISERVVQESIDMISQGRTVVIIAHRLSTISHADKIIVLDNGQVVETGAHDELLRRNGHYARLAGARR